MLIFFTSRHYYFFEKLKIVEKQLCKLSCSYNKVSQTLKAINHMGYRTRFLPYRHFFLQHLCPHELKYPIKHLGNYFKDTNVLLYGTNFLKFERKIVFEIFSFLSFEKLVPYIKVP